MECVDGEHVDFSKDPLGEIQIFTNYHKNTLFHAHYGCSSFVSPYEPMFLGKGDSLVIGYTNNNLGILGMGLVTPRF